MIQPMWTLLIKRAVVVGKQLHGNSVWLMSPSWIFSRWDINMSIGHLGINLHTAGTDNGIKSCIFFITQLHPALWHHTCIFRECYRHGYKWFICSWLFHLNFMFSKLKELFWFEHEFTAIWPDENMSIQKILSRISFNADILTVVTFHNNTAVYLIKEK